MMAPCAADSSSPDLASYYDKHMAIIDGTAYGWAGAAQPRRMLDGVTQVGVSQESYLALRRDGALLRWTDDAGRAQQVMVGVVSFAAGQSGVFAIDAQRVLWRVGSSGAPRRIADHVLAASIGDGADYYVTAEGHLYVHGNAHRGQYGDGQLRATAGFVRTADAAVDVKAHTGHALYLARNGDVFGTGGNIYGPLSTPGLGDKVATWSRIFQGAQAIATGSSHSAAIDRRGALWIWGAGYGPAPQKILENVAAVAAGSSATLARTDDGALWRWSSGSKTPTRLRLPAR